MILPRGRQKGLAVATAGAYGSMGSQYNSRPRPPEVLVHAPPMDHRPTRETLEDLVAIAGQIIAGLADGTDDIGRDPFALAPLDRIDGMIGVVRAGRARSFIGRVDDDKNASLPRLCDKGPSSKERPASPTPVTVPAQAAGAIASAQAFLNFPGELPGMGGVSSLYRIPGLLPDRWSEDGSPLLRSRFSSPEHGPTSRRRAWCW